jgi:hypothetical protein
MLNVAKRTVQRAKKVLTTAPEEVGKIETGEATLGEVERKITQASSENKNVTLDKTGYPVPDRATDYWDRSKEAEEILRFIPRPVLR